jgi:hypothetical protein
MMLTEQELNKIFSWLPYRPDWPEHDNRKIDNVIAYYTDLIKNFTENKLFETYCSQDGGMTNYLEFICYPIGLREYDGPAIMVCVSLYAPVAAYGQTTFHKTNNSKGYKFITVDSVGLVVATQLKTIENEIVNILKKKSLILIDKDFASKVLPDEVAVNLEHQNLNYGNQYLNGLFQWQD